MWREAKREPNPCPAVRAHDMARSHAEHSRERQSLDQSLVVRCKPVNWHRHTLSFMERGKTWTQALLYGASLRLGKDTG